MSTLRLILLNTLVVLLISSNAHAIKRAKIVVTNQDNFIRISQTLGKREIACHLDKKERLTPGIIKQRGLKTVWLNLPKRLKRLKNRQSLVVNGKRRYRRLRKKIRIFRKACREDIYYVDMNSISGNCSDLNSGTEKEPWCSVQKALDTVNEGGVIRIKPGVYDISEYTKTIDYPLTIIGDDKHSTVINNSLGYRTINLKDSLTVKNLKFTGPSGLFVFSKIEEGDEVDGFYVDNCIFDGTAQPIRVAWDSVGNINNINITNSDFLNMNAGKVRPIAFDSGTISNVNIVNNRFINLTSTTKLCIGIHLVGCENCNVIGNYFENISGPDGGPEVKAAIAYGNDVDFSYNGVVNFQAGTDHEAFYFKTTNSLMSENVLIDATSSQGAIAVKSDLGPNTIRDNRIQSSKGGVGIYSASAIYPVFKNNYVKMYNPTVSGVALYVYYSTDTPFISENNYGEASHIGQYVSGTGSETENSIVSNNFLVSYNYSGVYLDTSKSRPLYLSSWNGRYVTDSDNTKLMFTGNPPDTPVAVASANVESGKAPLVVKFSGKSSYDPNGEIVSYEWNFHDGTTSSKVNPTHTFTESRTYMVTLIVTDSDGFKDMDWIKITT